MLVYLLGRWIGLYIALQNMQQWKIGQITCCAQEGYKQNFACTELCHLKVHTHFVKLSFTRWGGWPCALQFRESSPSHLPQPAVDNKWREYDKVVSR